MKRLIAAGILLVLVIACNAYSTKAIVGICDHAIALAEQAQEEKIGGQDPSDTLYNLKYNWEKDGVLLSLFVNHTLLLETEQEIETLFYSSQNGEDDLFPEHFFRLKSMLFQIEESARLTWKSVS